MAQRVRTRLQLIHYPGMFHLSKIPMQIAFCKVGWGGGRRRERPRSVKGKFADAIVYAWLARRMRRSLHMYMFATRAHRGFNKFTSSVAIASAPSSFSGDYLDTEICRELQEQLCDPQCSEVSCNKQMNRSPSSPLLSSPLLSSHLVSGPLRSFSSPAHKPFFLFFPLNDV